MIQRTIAPMKKTRTETVRQQVYQELRRAIEQGTFKPGMRLPASRAQAITLGVSRNSVLWALDRLQSEGYVVARVGDGSYVADNLGALASFGKARKGLRPTVAAGLSQRGQLVADTVLRWNPPLQVAQPFRIGAPEIATFPFALWDRLARQASKEQRMAQAQYLDPAGSPALRDAIAQWLWVSRGIRCEAAQVVVCSGSQQGIDLVGRLLVDVGDEAWVEDPGYPGIRANLMGHGVTVRPVPVDIEGLMVDQAISQWPNARLAVVTPTSQFPTGVRMSLQRRLALVDWANTQRAWIVEDDYDGEFQYGTHRLPALCSLPHAQRVLYIGTFSKTLHPGLRLGFVVLPHALAGAFAMARAMTDRHSPGDAQEVLARFITDGHLLRHLRRMRELYPQRQQVLIDALAKASKGLLLLLPSEQGMHLLHELPEGQDDQILSAQALEAGILLAPLSRYTVASKRRGWLFGYAGYDTAALRKAAVTVGKLLYKA
jgi:GntR family transcriptional regulator/MocR family aminotransferase